MVEADGGPEAALRVVDILEEYEKPLHQLVLAREYAQRYSSKFLVTAKREVDTGIGWLRENFLVEEFGDGWRLSRVEE